ncbi:DUF2061 domain-containing protein [Halosolutus gelatinilyticus]|uniref:DUF2061 domain-containing protein n=1 Tax=Halosolutus gelatinilyticus TaxID=2931975 RepID=UPI001FF54840|nr:DUF2061 domain-containing protein [Halosolutus gelatinilyticus]
MDDNSTGTIPESTIDPDAPRPTSDPNTPHPRIDATASESATDADRSITLLARGSRTRALCKALCYRVLMLLTTVGIALGVTGDPSVAIDIGLATTIIKTATYYGYERLWNAV